MRGLTRFGWLANQPTPFQDLLKAAGRWRRHDRREALYEVGGQPRALYGLAEGSLDILMPTRSGDMITVHRAEPGFWIGDSALLAKAPRLVSVFAAPGSQVFSVPAEAVREILRKEPEHWRCFYELSHMNVSRAMGEYVALVSSPPGARLRSLLLRLSHLDGKVSATQTELAALLGVNRSSIQRALDEMVAAGTIRTGYRCIWVIKDAHADGPRQRTGSTTGMDAKS